ncbi:MAG: exopolysaccharide biosynthesis polyprenyl glycosylphosphotransferase [Lachnospiraceae bacterium]|nr:exopolysaccharide biosynthesis polyprenyl glycosylphosphotransferase [Lachnospiraceae bacterium]
MRMRELSTKFQHSIVFLIELLLYLLCLLTFFLMFSIDNPEIIAMSRTAAVTLSTFVIMLILLTFMYGRYDAGRRRWGQVALSVSITLIITDLITYLELSIMKTNEANNTTFKLENIGILFLVFALQIVVICLLSYAGEAFYFWINRKEKCLVVALDPQNAGRVAKALSSFEKRYELSEIVSYEDPLLTDKMVAADTIVMYDLPVEERKRIIDFCYQNLKNIYFNPDIADILEQNSRQVILDDISMFSTRYHMITFEERLVKRLMDTVISLVAIILTSPVLIVSVICIKRHDGGSVFFRQKRATVHGRVFEIIKFRTMRENVENYSSTEKDDRITPVGRVLRKYRIDELPQFVNILKGDMSLVGPRPEMLENVEDYEKDLPEFRYRLRMKAGLTGYAQIYGKYNTSSRDKLMLDLMYIENYSLIKDVQLLFQTILVLFKAEDSTSAFESDAQNMRE